MTAKNRPTEKPATVQLPHKNPDAVDPRLLGVEKRGTEPSSTTRAGGGGTKQGR